MTRLLLLDSNSLRHGMAVLDRCTLQPLDLFGPPGAGIMFAPFDGRDQIRPHYLEPGPASTHLGGTRDRRNREFREDNAPPALVLRDGAMLRVDGDEMRLLGIHGARPFERGKKPREFGPDERRVFWSEEQ